MKKGIQMGSGSSRHTFQELVGAKELLCLCNGKCPNNRSFPLGRPKSDRLLGQKSNFDVDALIEPINWSDQKATERS